METRELFKEDIMLKRIFALVLAFVLLLSLLASCNETAVQDGGDRKDGSWEGVDFKGQTVSLCISTTKSLKINYLLFFHIKPPFFCSLLFV